MTQTYSLFTSGTGGDTPATLVTHTNANGESLRSQFSGTSAPTNPVEGQVFFNTSEKRRYVYVLTSETEGYWRPDDNVAVTSEVVTARGTTSTLNTRLSVALNDDGSLKESVPLTANKWVAETNAVAYVDSTSFTVGADVTAIYIEDRALKLTQTVNEVGYVLSSVYDSGTNLTTVLLKSGTVDSGLDTVEYSTLVKENQPYIDIDTLPSQAGNDDKFLKTDGTTASWAEIGGGLPIGSFISIPCTADYIPDGCLPCDGSEYSQSQFPALWTNYLTSSPVKLQTCTYAEYATSIATYGSCAKFAVDTTNNTFKVPTIKDGAVIQQALSDTELGKAYNAGLPNITGSSTSFVKYEGTSTGAIQASGSATGDGTGYSGSNNLRTLTFDASLSNDIYGNSTTVQMNAITARVFVVVANAQINQSQMDWSAWATSLAGKATVDMTNITATGKETVVGWGMPDYTAEVSVASLPYTAPSKGVFRFTPPDVTSFKHIMINGIIVFENIDYAGGNNQQSAYLSVDTNDVISSDGTPFSMYFYPLKGVN